MADLNTLLPLVREKCAGMLTQQARDQLKKAYRTFCIESGFVQKSELVSIALDGSVTLNPPPETYINAIHSVRDKDNRKLEKGAGYTVDLANQVKLVNSTGTATITYSIAPTIPIDNYFDADDVVLQRWSDEIAAGAASLLQLMPGKKWSDTGAGDFHNRLFIKGYRDAYQLRILSEDEADEAEKPQKRVFI